MKRTIGGIPVFAAIIAILLGVLQVVNWIPSAVQDGEFARFKSIDDAREHLKLAHLFVPVYYPRGIRWPPSLVAGQLRPYPAVVMEFPGSGGDDTALAISQTAGTHAPVHQAIVLETVLERTPLTLKGRAAVLESGVALSGERCSRLTWDEEGFRIVVATTESPAELLRIAESMLPGRGAAPAGTAAAGT